MLERAFIGAVEDEEEMVLRTGRWDFRVQRILRDDSRYDAFPVESRAKRRFYNVGAGSFRHDYWTNIDFATPYYRRAQRHRFLNYDLTSLRPLPIDSGGAEIVYSSHTIEHVPDAAAANLLCEAHRVLKAGGVCRVTAPDAALHVEAWRRGDRSFFGHFSWYSSGGRWRTHFKVPPDQAPLEQLLLYQLATPCAWIAKHSTHSFPDAEITDTFAAKPVARACERFGKLCVFRPEAPGDHINWWTYEKLISFFADAGFRGAYRSAPGQSASAPLRDTLLFDNTHPQLSLYVEAIKT